MQGSPIHARRKLLTILFRNDRKTGNALLTRALRVASRKRRLLPWPHPVLPPVHHAPRCKRGHPNQKVTGKIKTVEEEAPTLLHMRELHQQFIALQLKSQFESQPQSRKGYSI